MKENIFVFDTETNGLSDNNSVLNFSAIVAVIKDNKITVKKIIDRYYYPVENFNKKAIKVNGLNKNTIEKKRASATYSEHFVNDKEIKEQIKSYLFNNYTIVAHNLSFDTKFIRDFYQYGDFELETILLGRSCCTMLNSIDICNLYHPYYNKKYPTLQETAEAFNIDTDYISDLVGGYFHNSLFDVFVTAVIYAKLRIYEKISLLNFKEETAITEAQYTKISFNEEDTKEVLANLRTDGIAKKLIFV